MKPDVRRPHVMLGLVLLAMLAACSGAPGGEGAKTTFYSLAPDGAAVPIEIPAGAPTLLVGVGPVFLPDYLNRPQIVTHQSAYELEMSEFHRWGGSLESEIGRVITQNLAALLPHYRIVTLPLRTTADPDRQVALQVLNFERAAGGPVTLVVHWGILGKEGRQALALHQSAFTQAPADESYEAVVAAMSSTIGQLSRDIANEIARTAP